MKSHHSSIILSGAAVAAAMLLLTGCAKENGLNQWKNRDGGCAELVLTDVNSGEMLSKAAIDGTGFPRDGRIGLFFFKDEAGSELYGDSSCSNVEYSYNQDKSKWTASPAIRVGSTPGYLYGYYPYNGADKDVKAIAVESSLDGDDAMYVAKQDPVTDQTAGNVAITMRHALARVSITVKDKGYSGAAKLSRIEFVGAKTAQSGTLNALDGSISATKSDVTLEVPEASQQITEAGTRYECLLVPSEVDASARDVTLRLTIDGQQKTVALSGENALKIISGVKARLTIDLSDSGLSIVDGGIHIDEWQTIVVGGYTVTVKPDSNVTSHDILIDAYADGSNAVIVAISRYGKALSCKIGDAKCPRILENDSFIFTIENVTSDIEAVLGYAQSSRITVLCNNGGKVWIGNKEITTSREYEVGDRVTIHAMPEDDYQLFKWDDDDSRQFDREITVGETDSTYTAEFISANLIPALFTVNSEGRQVFFSKGNLWYGKVGASESSTFNFENEQWEFSPTSNGSRDATHVSHFFWSKFAHVACRESYIELEKVDRTDIFFTNMQESAGADKPNASFIVAGEANRYRTLSGGEGSEWEYLINLRTTKDNQAPTINGTSDARWMRCSVRLNNDRYVKGLLIFSDTFTWPKGDGAPAEDSAYGNSPATYSRDEFKKLEDAGCVFLPATGVFNGDVLNIGNSGIYWSSSAESETFAFSLFFTDDRINPGAGGFFRKFGYSVRLVMDAER